MVTVGRVVSLATVTETRLDVHCTPSTSRATALRLCEPLPTLLVFQETEYDAAESLPMKLPSTKKSTFWTVREPTMLTLALTGTVPLTMEPEAGDVTVTIRLPPGSGGGGSICANASCGAIQLQTTTASKAAARAIPFFTAPRSRLRRRSGSRLRPRAAGSPASALPFVPART